MTDLDERTPLGFTWREAIAALRLQATLSERFAYANDGRDCRTCGLRDRQHRMTETIRGWMCPPCAEEFQARRRAARKRLQTKRRAQRRLAERARWRARYLDGAIHAEQDRREAADNWEAILDVLRREAGRRRHIPDSIRTVVYARDGFRCLRCGAAGALSLDHIHPWSLGGSDEPHNLQTLCRPCNSSKGARIEGVA